MQGVFVILAKIGTAIVENGHLKTRLGETAAISAQLRSSGTLAMAVFLLAIGLAGAQFYAPAPLTPVQYTSANYPISAQPYEAQLVYVAA